MARKSGLEGENIRNVRNKARYQESRRKKQRKKKACGQKHMKRELSLTPQTEPAGDGNTCEHGVDEILLAS